MPTRLLREGILKSPRVNELDFAAEVFYRRLMSRVDDHGLYDALPSILRADLYPLRLDRVREADITRCIAACEKAGLIVLYQSGGKPYLQMLDTKWATRSEPKFPKPTVENSCSQPETPVPLVVGGGVFVIGGDDGADPTGQPPAALLPLNDGSEYGVTEAQVREYADLYRAIDVPAQLRAMRGWLLANPANRKTRNGVQRFVNRWLSQEQNKAGKVGAAPPSGVPRGKPAGPSETPLERAVAYARQQFHFGAIDETERDRLIAEATARHRGNGNG